MKSLEECRANIQEFANRFKLIFEDEGECGFGRKCVGITNGNNWVSYNPTNEMTHKHIESFFNQELYEIPPKDAYHKHDCIAVLGTGEDSIRQLSEWVDKLNDFGAIVEIYETGATGLQAIFSGLTNHAVKIPE